MSKGINPLVREINGMNKGLMNKGLKPKRPRREYYAHRRRVATSEVAGILTQKTTFIFGSNLGTSGIELI